MFAKLRTLTTVAAVIGALVVAFPAPASATHGGQTRFLNKFSDKCLEIPYFHTHNSVQAAQWSCHGEANQQWDYSTRTGMIMNINSGLCLEVFGGSTADGAPVGQFECRGGANQVWHLNERNGLIGNSRSGKCLEIYGWSTADFAPAVQWECHGGANQVWGWHFR